MIQYAPSARLAIAIVDPCCLKAYGPGDLMSSGLGGTEATVLRVAKALLPDFEVTHFQNNRESVEGSPAGKIVPLRDIFRPGSFGVYLVVNRWKLALKLRKRFPHKPIVLWLHVYPGRHNRKMGQSLKAADIGVICVSATHADALSAFLPAGDRPQIGYIYNPIADDLAPQPVARDPARLLFASSPHKGLAQVFRQFSALRSRLPQLSLYVADPGYLKWDTGPTPDGVHFLGALSHDRLIAQMRQSLCLFYPQTSFHETFGLVLAEANAVGTPVLAHWGLGANDEVLQVPGQTVDCENPEAIHAAILRFQEKPFVVKADPRFRLSSVREDWRNFLISIATGEGFNALSGKPARNTA